MGEWEAREASRDPNMGEIEAREASRDPNMDTKRLERPLGTLLMTQRG